MAKTSSAANAFGAGSDLIGMTCRGKEIVHATRQYMHLEDGRVVPRQGNRVEYESDRFSNEYFEPNDTVADDL